MRFVGRKRELAVLEDLYGRGGFQMPVIYGRRRVGKTALINRFIEGKPAMVFTARESTARENLAALSRAVLALERGAKEVALEEAAPVFESFEAAFAALFRLGRERRVVFAIDEFPYLARSERSVSSLLQGMIDREKASSSLFLILCGSSMSFMEHQVLGYESPLYGRRTAQVKVEPFDVFEAAALMQWATPEQVVAYYGMVGGIPLYLEQFDESRSVEENLAQRLLRPDSFLYGEPDAFLQQELRDPAPYNAIIQAIAAGTGKPKEIAEQAGVERSALPAYLGALMELGLVAREQPVLDANRKKVRYRLADNLFRFWYRFVPRYMTPLQAGREHEVASLIAGERLSTYLGPVYEQVCGQWLLYRASAQGLPLVLDVGRWWGADPQRREQAEIDLVAPCDDGSVVFGECKWRNRPLGAEVIDALAHRSQLVAADGRRLFAFSKEGFTDAARRRARELDVRLVSLSEMGIGA